MIDEKGRYWMSRWDAACFAIAVAGWTFYRHLLALRGSGHESLRVIVAHCEPIAWDLDRSWA